MFIYAEDTLTNLDQVVQIYPYVQEVKQEYAVAIRDVNNKITYLSAVDEDHMYKIISILASRIGVYNIDRLTGL